MKKTIYIPKGQESKFENLTCDRIVVNGSLHVDGKLKAKQICGKGFLYAKWISASSITADTVDADTIVTDTLEAARVYAFDIYAVRGMVVTSLVKANYVKTGHITYCDAEIWDIEAGEAVKLAPKRRGLFRALVLSAIYSGWAWLTNAAPQENHVVEEENAAPQENEPTQDIQEKTDMAQPDIEEAVKLVKDPEFLRIKALYRLTKETGDIWQIVPKPEQTDRAVVAFQPITAA